MAKGVEDTAFYRYFRLAALNEVGGNPGALRAVSVDEFHEANASARRAFPLHLLTTYTHDTKRSPDVRSRIVALTWLADEWAERVRAWHDASSAGSPTRARSARLPDARRRAGRSSASGSTAYLEKALREGKVNTNWLDAERGARARGAGVRARAPPALIAATRSSSACAELGRRLSLAQLLLKLTAPGVPDVYRGDELEDARRSSIPTTAGRSTGRRAATALAALRDGAPLDDANAKLYVTWRTLGAARASTRTAFAGSYEPVDRGGGVCAFVRGGEVLVAAAVRPGRRRRACPTGWRDVLGVEGLALAVQARARSSGW